MARKKKSKQGTPTGGWMVTFSDLVTLLLTFFVLLLSMSTMDKSIVIKAFTLFRADIGFILYKSSSRIPTKHNFIAEIIEKPWEVLEKQSRIKDLLFPDDAIPPDINRSTLEENINILLRPEGVSIVMSDSLLFKPGSWELKPEAEFIVSEIANLLLVMSAPVNVAGYTDALPSSGLSNYELSSKRALTVARILLGHNLENDRLSVSAYGPNFPLEDNTTEEGRAANRRVEILIKTAYNAKTFL